MPTCHQADVDGVHVGRIGSSGDQLPTNVRCLFKPELLTEDGV